MERCFNKKRKQEGEIIRVKLNIKITSYNTIQMSFLELVTKKTSLARRHFVNLLIDWTNKILQIETLNVVDIDLVFWYRKNVTDIPIFQGMCHFLTSCTGCQEIEAKSQNISGFWVFPGLYFSLKLKKIRYDFVYNYIPDQGCSSVKCKRAKFSFWGWLWKNRYQSELSTHWHWSEFW